MKSQTNKTVLFMLLCGLTINSFSQTDLYNSGQLYLTNQNDTLFVTGSVINTNSASLNNAGGNFYIKGNITNQEANMVAGGGKLWTNGTSTQIIDGSAPMRTFDWIVDNVGGITLLNRIGIGNTVGGTLTFVNGLITSGTNLQDVYFYPNSSYSGYSNSRHIMGYCSKSGSTDFTYPIGDGTFRADLDITNLSSSTDFQCKYFGNGYGIYTPSLPLVSVFEKEYWTLERTAGSSSSQITLKWNDARKLLNHSIPADLRVGHYNGASWISEGGVGSGNTSTGTVSSITVNSFSPFTFASTGIVLPLKITNYSATINNDCSVLLKWTSHDESEVSNYNIQKSADGVVWETVHIMDINTNLVNSTNHSYTDISSTSGTLSYRIKIEKENGSFIYSEIKKVIKNCIADKITVYPTVTNSIVNIVTPEINKIKSIAIYNQTGQLIRTIAKPLSSNTNINLANYPAGEYTIQVRGEKTSQSFKIIKPR